MRTRSPGMSLTLLRDPLKTPVRIYQAPGVRPAWVAVRALYARYRLLYEDPEHCRPMFIIHTPGAVRGTPTTYEQRVADPLVMLGTQLAALQTHLDIGDDCVPSVSIDFGTAQVAAAFGCELFFPENNTPAAGTHVLTRAADVYTMRKPSLDAGWYGKLWEWIAIYKQHLPPGVHIAHADIQSTFNSSHLIRGNDILTDFYDEPEAVDALLDLVTDYMIDITRYMKSHCGTAPSVIDDFFTIDALNGLDVEFWRHDFYDLVRKMPSGPATARGSGQHGRQIGFRGGDRHQVEFFHQDIDH